MAEIKTNINHLKTYLSDLEIQTTNLIDNRVTSSAPKAREIAQKMKLILLELRKDIQKNAAEVPVKKRVKKVEPAKAVVEEVSAVVEASAAQRDEVPRGTSSPKGATRQRVEPEVPIEPVVEPPIEQTAASSEAKPPRGSPRPAGSSGSTVEPPKSAKKRRAPVSKKSK